MQIILCTQIVISNGKKQNVLTLIAGHPRLVGAVAPLVLLDLLQLVVVEAHSLLDALLRTHARA